MSCYSINPNKIYQFPSDINTIAYNNSYIVIAPSTANWIVLKSLGQLSVLKYLQAGHSINEALENSILDNQDIGIVITQIEARRFCTKKVRSITDDKRALHLYLTNKCNLSCPHCYMFSGKSNKSELTTEEILHLIYDYANIANGHRITLSGGEPTIHADFETIVKTAYDLGLEVSVLTNGSLLTPTKIAKLAKFISSIQISIDGYSEESNSTIRGKGQFGKALSTIDSFIKNGVETSVAITPSLDLLRSHAKEYTEFARSLATKYVSKPFRVKFAEGLSSGRTIEPTAMYNKEYAEIVSCINRNIYEDDFDLISFVELMRNDVLVDNCMFGVFAIASNGDVFFCPEIGKLSPIANIRTSSFEEIYIKSLAAECATSISKLNPCKECLIRNICGGGCRITEFPELTNRSSFEYLDYSSIPPRRCNQETKERFYDLMVRSNEYLFVPLQDQ